MSGMLGKILRVDLTTHELREEKLDQKDIGDYVGADPLGVKILYDEVPAGVGALDPENRLIFMAGPISGTNAQATGMHSLTAKSPATGFTVGQAHAMGWFGAMLKFAGYDGIVVQGKAERPVYLWVNEGKAELRDAGHLWGKDTFETDDAIKQELGQPKLACDCIGPAGENLSNMAAIVHDKGHVGARGGLGAVMGSKNLKAVAVYGTGKVPIVREEEFKTLAAEWRKANMASPPTQSFSQYGTPVFFESGYKIGDVPIKGYTHGEIEGWEKMTGEHYIDTMVVKKKLTCYSCTIAHNRLIELKGGAYEGHVCELPEFEDVVAWGTMIGVTDPTVAAYGSELCDRLGFDALAASNAIAFAMECYEKGLITEKDTDGLDLRFGNYEVAFKLMERIARREGFGNVLANGAFRAAEHIRQGSEKFVVHSKGMALPMHDHRSAWGYALGYAVNSAGPVHQGGTLMTEMSGRVDRFSTVGKAKMHRDSQIVSVFHNSLGVCDFGTYGVSLKLLCQALSAATGREFTHVDAQRNGLRAVNVARAFNIRHGLTPADDTLGYRYTDEAPPDGGAKGSKVNLKPMVREYYDLMGWDQKTGKPYRNTLEALGLTDVAREMWG